MPIILRSVSLWIAAVLAIPTSLILVSWSALPGDKLYGVKRGLEEGPRVAFHVAGSKSAADYEVYIADRRFSEATTLAKKDDTAGLKELQTSITATKNVIVQTQNDQARETFIQNLVAYNQKLETQKETIIATAPTPVRPTPSAVSPTAPPQQSPPIQTTVTVTSIDDTQEEIEKTIDELTKNRSATRARVSPESKGPKSPRKNEQEPADDKSQQGLGPSQQPQQTASGSGKYNTNWNYKSKN